MRNSGFLRGGMLFALVVALWLGACAPAFAASADAVWPEADGINVQQDGKLLIDASHMEQGYIMARVSEPGSNRFKVRVTFNGGQLMYDLNREGNFEVIPLQLGSGKYDFALYENVKSTKYAAAGQIALSVQLSDENAAYLVTNQYVDYELLTAAVQKSDELCGGATGQDAYNIITDFIASDFAYDFVRAKTIAAGELPDIDYCYENRMGICQDLSAVMVCMLRVQGVPSRLVIGYADKYYHAWTTTLVDGQEVFFDPTAAVGALSGIKKYQIERMY